MLFYNHWGYIALSAQWRKVVGPCAILVVCVTRRSNIHVNIDYFLNTHLEVSGANVGLQLVCVIGECYVVPCVVWKYDLQLLGLELGITGVTFAE